MKFPIVTVAIAAILLGLFFAFGAMPETFIWQDNRPYSWQLISAHFVHISTEHLAWNLIAFVILASIIEQHSVKHLLLSLLVGTVSVNLYLLTLFDMPAYAGLSGILNTLLVIALYQTAQRPEYRTAALVSFIASIVKVLVEWATGDAVFSSLIWQSVPLAHLAGLLGGMASSIVYVNYSRLFKNNNQFSYT